METKNIKIAIVGYGSMGKEVEKATLLSGLTITNIFDIDNPLDDSLIYDFDVAVDFTFPESVQENVQKYARLGKNAVIGTTGWLDKFDEVKEIVDSSGIGVVYGSNFSIGMQIFSRLIKQASSLLNNAGGYDIMLHEIHHKRKKDSPSGTALTLANLIIQNYRNKNRLETNTISGSLNPETLHVTSTRGGEIAGLHSVYIDSTADTIELIHRAKNRSGFAFGTIEAARWVQGKKGLYNFDDVMKEIFND